MFLKELVLLRLEGLFQPFAIRQLRAFDVSVHEKSIALRAQHGDFIGEAIDPCDISDTFLFRERAIAHPKISDVDEPESSVPHDNDVAEMERAEVDAMAVQSGDEGGEGLDEIFGHDLFSNRAKGLTGQGVIVNPSQFPVGDLEDVNHRDRWNVARLQ